ncbi:helix-turn-helix transcriptional regulator [Massilia violaceinigra]|uniref:Helix-turn-helix transcriptional regulator n=1 Tax=Massilia violaceinigra TaxID=2045208 RepID=A0ABY4AB35_9BURK|nr:helix-turn-helix domain-containing protein [Massilia violaceinigra]UOD31365.1 helix-turn-helix transcriptional regulator [Massilia violaceinigra]
MMQTALSLILLLAMGQGVFLAIALLAARQAELRGANRLLAGLLLGSVAVIGHAWLGINHLYTTYPHSALAIATIGLLSGPLLYLYLRTALTERRLGARDWLHGAPFLLATGAMLPFYLQSAEAKLAWMLQRPLLPWYIGLSVLVKSLMFICYVVASYRLMRGAASGPLAGGLARLAKIWVLGAAGSVAAFGIEFADVALPLSSDAVGAIALACFVYATAFLAIRLPLGYLPPAPATLPAPLPEPAPRYANKRLSEPDRAGFLDALKRCMEVDQVYRNGELTLDELAALLAMTPHELSQLINDACGVNLQEYLNRYRVDALKAALLAPEQASTSILDLALACGFNSKTTLNRAFKKQTGLTPSEFRRGGAGTGAESSSGTTLPG